MHKTYIYGRDATNETVNVVENLSLIKILRMEKYQLGRFSEVMKKSYDVIFRNAQVSFINNQLPNFFTLLVFSIILNFGQFVNKVTLDFLGVTIRLFQSVSKIADSISKVANAQVHIQEFVEIEKGTELKNQNYFNIDKSGNIALENISFKYKKSDSYIFKNLNFEIKKNTHNIIVGSNGSGKSTLGNAILNVLRLTAPDVKIAGDVNLNIESSLLAINKWFLDKSNNQQLRFDLYEKNQIDVTFLRVNKTMDWFDNKKNKNNSKKINISEKIKNIIFLNKDKFNNFDNKKFIIFFEGWERRKYINFNICGKADFDGNISIYYTFSRFKKYIGKEVILKNKQRIFTCTKNDHLNNVNDLTFGDAEATILHELLHTLGAPSKCGNNLDNNKSHVLDNANDILNNESGNKYLDYNNNDYYNHNIKDCPDLKNSEFLITN